jgi:hypothetical protein
MMESEVYDSHSNPIRNRSGDRVTLQLVPLGTHSTRGCRVREIKPMSQRGIA